MTQQEPPSEPGTAPRHRHGLGRGRATRRAERRDRNWRIVAWVALGFVVFAGAAAGGVVLFVGDDAASSAPAAKRSGPPPTTPTTSVPTSSTAPGRPCRAPLTTDAPLRLWIAGDSIAWSVGNGLGRRAAGTGVVAPVYESRVSSGLSTPGFFDWARRAGEELPRLNPEIVVFVMGTNDWAAPQATPVDTTGQPAWKAGYAKQVQAMVDTLTSGGRSLYWVGPPVLREAKQEAGSRAVAQVIEDVVAKNPNVEFIDMHDLLDADDGSYTAVIEVDGKKVQVRAGDGVHLTPDGGDLVGDAIFAALDARCRLKAQAVTGARQPLVETKGSTSVPAGGTATAPPQPTTPAAAPPTTTPAGTTPAGTTPAATSPPTTPPTVAPTAPATTTTASPGTPPTTTPK